VIDARHLVFTLYLHLSALTCVFTIYRMQCPHVLAEIPVAGDWNRIIEYHGLSSRMREHPAPSASHRR